MNRDRVGLLGLSLAVSLLLGGQARAQDMAGDDTRNDEAPKAPVSEAPKAAPASEAPKAAPASEAPKAAPASESSPSLDLAKAIDAQIDAKIKKQGVDAAAQADDAEFLRRVWIDIAGDMPRPKEVAAFLADSDPDKRRKKVDELLALPETSRNWAEFWTDVVDRESTTKLREDQFKAALRGWLADRLQEGLGFDEIVRRVVSAEGLVKDNGAVGYVISYMGADMQPDAQALAATTARVFMGLQIECAQCHNHPFVNWKRDDFMGLAAYFARARLDREIVGTRPDPAALRKMSQEEREKALADYRKMQAMAPLGIKEAAMGELHVEYQTAKNPGDGSMAPAPPAPAPAQPKRGLFGKKADDGPPKYVAAPRFIVSGLTSESRDGNRRELLGRLITSDQDPYFASCCANRIWGRLTGRPLVAPTEDFSDANAPHDSELLAILAKGFKELRYDHKAFVRAICLSQAYGRSSRATPDAEGKVDAKKVHSEEELYARGVVRPIDARPLARALIRASVLGERGLDDLGPLQKEGTLRRFERIFGGANLDPKSYEESIPEALFLINGPSPGGPGPYAQLGNMPQRPQGPQGPGIAARRRQALQRLLDRESDERERVTAVYVAVLARPAAKREIEETIAYVKDQKDPLTGYEDLLWALVNSAEFRFNR